MTTALITGITGMVGSHLTDYLLEHTNWNIAGVCRWRSPLDNVAHLLDRANKGDRLTFRYADLNDQMSLVRVIRELHPDYIFHLAAQSYPQTSFTAPVDTLNTNILGTCRLLEALLEQSRLDKEYKPVIHVCASSEVFGKIPRDKVPAGGIHEDCPFDPASPYAISKIGTDLLGRYYAEAYGLTVMTTRMFTHTGPRRGDVFHESTFAKQIALIERGAIEPVVKVGNLDSLRTYADVRDAVRAYFLLVTVNPVPGEYYNIGGTHTCTVGDTLKTLISFSPRAAEIKVETDPSRLRPVDADLQIPDCSKFKAHTGWQPEIPYETTMRDLLDYWRQRSADASSYLVR
ncbi:MAG: GDP-mannose 4,6-dehydratase [Succinivibrio sp.]|nr:GDP-mannose 4,6-dehydratase [Succinivibrio sp.]